MSARKQQRPAHPIPPHNLVNGRTCPGLSSPLLDLSAVWGDPKRDRKIMKALGLFERFDFAMPPPSTWRATWQMLDEAGAKMVRVTNARVRRGQSPQEAGARPWP